MEKRSKIKKHKKGKNTRYKSKFANKYSERIKSIRDSDAKAKEKRKKLNKKEKDIKKIEEMIKKHEMMKAYESMKDKKNIRNKK